MKFIEWMDNLSFTGKIIMSLPLLDLSWGIYRIIKGAEYKNSTLLVIGILWIVLGWNILWIIDLVTTLIQGKPVLTDLL
ncbi:hypothetical protein [Acholeplasma granularum]|uniref:hypothetical protein n=1 Tax=Acholeplasma granularum TaxID=264635 RepID=UPI0004723478|nr:hypothetical protein [Acholeplasma granularum]